MDLELEDIVLFYLELRDLDKGGRVLVVAHVVLARTDLEDHDENQQQRVHLFVGLFINYKL